MKFTWTALLSGTLFGAGLSTSQMTNPAKVIAFLDVSGSWDPSLAFVMGSALVVSAIAVQIERFSRKQESTRGPTRSVPLPIDRRLVFGASLFGLGWGLAGLCPGPALAGLVSGSGQLFLFVCAMFVGIGLFQLVPGRTVEPTQVSTSTQNTI